MSCAILTGTDYEAAETQWSDAFFLSLSNSAASATVRKGDVRCLVIGKASAE